MLWIRIHYMIFIIINLVWFVTKLIARKQGKIQFEVGVTIRQLGYGTPLNRIDIYTDRTIYIPIGEIFVSTADRN